MKRGMLYFALAGIAELIFLYWAWSINEGFINLSEYLFFLGVFALLLSLSFFFGVERKLNLLQMSGKPDGVKEGLNASLIESLFSGSKKVVVDYPLGLVFLMISVINLVAYFIIA